MINETYDYYYKKYGLGKHILSVENKTDILVCEDLIIFYVNGFWHRENGPAIIRRNYGKQSKYYEWFIQHNNLTDEVEYYMKTNDITYDTMDATAIFLIKMCVLDKFINA